MTSNQNALRFAGSILIKATALNGLAVDSVALAGQVRAIDRNRIESRTHGNLGSSDQQAVDVQLRLILGL